MPNRLIAVALVAFVGLLGAALFASRQKDDLNTIHVVAANQVAAGRYLAVIEGCNDCHTATWTSSEGRTPDRLRLLGNPVAFQGSLGTMWAKNLRVIAPETSEWAWIAMFRENKGGSYMPWWNFRRHLGDDDLRAIRAYIISLGATGRPMPSRLSPGVSAPGPIQGQDPIPAAIAQTQ